MVRHQLHLLSYVKVVLNSSRAGARAYENSRQQIAHSSSQLLLERRAKCSFNYCDKCMIALSPQHQCGAVDFDRL